MASAPPAASIIAAANCGGAIECGGVVWGVPSRQADSPVVSAAPDRDNDRNPSAVEAIAAHTHSTPAMSMESQYEAAGPQPVGASCCRLARDLIRLNVRRLVLRRADGHPGW
jgi:hypothetical protein